VKKVLIVLFSVVVLTGAGLTAQSTHGSIQGVWQAVEVTLTGPGARIITIPEPRPNLIIITAKYYSRVEVHAEGPRPILADVARASADELRAVWGSFVGEAGTYELAASQLTLRPIAAKNPAVMAPGAFIVYSFKLDGNTMFVTQQRDHNGPVVNPATIKSVRVE
jgi:hypothetical protein